jgi:hypothetical protein
LTEEHVTETRRLVAVILEVSDLGRSTTFYRDAQAAGLSGQRADVAKRQETVAKGRDSRSPIESTSLDGVARRAFVVHFGEPLLPGGPPASLLLALSVEVPLPSMSSGYLTVTVR